MAFNPYNIDLPVVSILDQVKSTLQEDTTLIVNAPPGAGKSTLLPLALLDEDWLGDKKILMLEPRRLAARTIAERMASLLGEKVGETIGYRIRFDNKVGPNTKIEVVTEGILTRMIHQDNSLENVSLVIFDEFHERSIHADIALALCREAQEVLRPDLRILIMSATLDMPQLESLLKAPSIVSDGRQYPIDIVYSGEADEYLLAEMTARTVVRAVREQTEGDTLVFLPGQWEIRKCEELLRRELRDFAIHPLYGMLPQEKQYRAITPDKQGRRKVVLATSIAETSLTIQQIKIVVDSGFGRKQRFDPKSGLSRLETVFIDKDSADQRAGRAGRLSAGVCYRMWTRATQDRMQEHRVPEILETDLSSLVLDMSLWGIMNIEELTWLTPPTEGSVRKARQVLNQIGAIENNRVTEHGKKVHALPCHPRLAHMLLKADENGLAGLATDLAAILEERDPLTKEAGIDINKRIEILRRDREENRLGRKMRRIDQVASSYRRMLDVQIENTPFDSYETGLLLVYAFPERIAFSRPGNNAQFQLANGKFAMAGHKDDLAHEPWLAVASIDARDGLGKIFLASPLNPIDLQPLLEKKEVVSWDTRKGGLSATQDLRIGSIILQSKPMPDPPEEFRVKAISEAIEKEGAQLLNFSPEVTQWQNRILSLKKWRPQDKWPDVSTSTLLATNIEWLEPYLQSVKKPEDLQKLNLLEILHHHLDYDKQQQLDTLCPQKIEVPSGSKIKLEYHKNGETPVLAVRIQEVFGMENTPAINDGRIPLLLHLLSPGYKPVQVTTDLNSFWNNTYFEVKKELKRRYPKHVWPDEPWLEKATSRAKKRTQN